MYRQDKERNHEPDWRQRLGYEDDILSTSRHVNGSRVMSKFGPGIWYTIHTISLKSNNRADQMSFASTLWTLVRALPCPVCKEHATTYYKENPPQDHVMRETHLNNGVTVKAKYAMFVYTFNFHNTVNEKLGKKQISLDTAYQIYASKMSLGGDEYQIHVDLSPYVNQRATTNSRNRSPERNQSGRSYYYGDRRRWTGDEVRSHKMRSVDGY